eukprot:gene21974-6667_t
MCVILKQKKPPLTAVPRSRLQPQRLLQLSFHSTAPSTEEVAFEAVGPSFPSLAWRRRLGHSLSVDRPEDAEAGPAEEQKTIDYEEDPLEEVDAFSMLPIDSADYKEQDHYALLGLKKLRYKASREAIDLQLKRMTIRHHPDKKSTGDMTDAQRSQADMYLAYEQLSNPGKRLLYDSVDVDDSYDIVPDATKDAAKFYKTFSLAFKRNARWFVDEVPEDLGDENTTQDEVEDFYSAWYNTPTWRKFGYNDRENADNASSRDEKRYMEQKNKAERKKLDVAEKKRMLSLIDNAYKSDPRRIKFKADKKAAKEAAVKEREDAKAAAIKAKADAIAAAAAAEAAAKADSKDANETARKARQAFAKKCKKMKAPDGGDGFDPVTKEQTDVLKTILDVAVMKEMTAQKERADFLKLLSEAVTANADKL